MSTMADVPAAPLTFKRRAHDALENAQLRRNFRGAMDFLMAKRAAQFPDADERAAERRSTPRVAWHIACSSGR